jgi:hypothetical protein
VRPRIIDLGKWRDASPKQSAGCLPFLIEEPLGLPGVVAVPGLGKQPEQWHSSAAIGHVNLSRLGEYASASRPMAAYTAAPSRQFPIARSATFQHPVLIQAPLFTTLPL